MRAKWMLAVAPLALVVACGSSAASGPVSLGTEPATTFTPPPDPGTFAPEPPAETEPPDTSPPETVAPPPESAYDQALDQLATHCTQSRDFLAGMVPKVLKDLQDNGVNDETLTSVAQHLTTVASGVPGKTDCVGVAAAYAVTREPS